ncbi:MAG: HAMP domain-containing protein, partial [Caldilineaceae bacterium]|nr:HAMP domain-containing protein [Caldilineaceae bacterium]
MAAERRVTSPERGGWPWQRSLQQRIVLTYGVIFFGVLVFLMVWVGRIVYAAQLSDAEHNLELQAYLAANTLEDPLSGYNAEFDAFARWESSEDTTESEEDDHDDERGDRRDHAEGEDEGDHPTVLPSTTASPSPAVDRLQQLARVYATDTGARVTILDAQGNPVVDSQFVATTLDNQIDEREVQTALRSEEMHDVRTDPLTGVSTLFVAAPIEQSNTILGFVRLARPLSDITRGIWALLLQLFALGLLALTLATVLGYWIARRIVRPVQKLEEASLAIAGGDFSQQVPVESHDEIGALGGAFNHMAEQVSHMMTQQRLFVANASHELRTPLTNIKLRSEALLSGIDDADLSQRYLREIDSEADRLGHLAATLLDLSRLDAAVDGKNGDPVDLLPMLHNVVAAQRLRIEQNGLNFHVELPPSLPSVRVWPEQIESILVNLLDNALKYTPPGQSVTLSAQAIADNLQIVVADTGNGIPAEDLPHI